MSPRKPAGESWESWVERQIREAQARGEFDDLPGAGQPERREPYDENWWIRRKLERENFSYLPPTLQVRKDVEEARSRIAEARSERRVREIATAINRRIRQVNRTAVHGPPSSVAPLDVEATVEEWRRHRASGTGA